MKQEETDGREGKKEMNPEMDPFPYPVTEHETRLAAMPQPAVDEKIVGRSRSVSTSVIGCFGVTGLALPLKTLVLIIHFIVASEPQDLKTTAAAADQKQSVA